MLRLMAKQKNSCLNELLGKRRKEAEMKWSQSRREWKWIDTREGVQDRIQEGKQKMLEGGFTQDFITEFSFFLPAPPHQHLPPKPERDCGREGAIGQGWWRVLKTQVCRRCSLFYTLSQKHYHWPKTSKEGIPKIKTSGKLASEPCIASFVCSDGFER